MKNENKPFSSDSNSIAHEPSYIRMNSQIESHSQVVQMSAVEKQTVKDNQSAVRETKHNEANESKRDMGII